MARSVELVSAALLFSAFLLLSLLEPRLQSGFTDYFRSTVGQAGQVDISAEAMPGFIRQHMLSAGGLLAPFLMLTMLAVLAVNFLQVGFHFSTQSLNPDLSRLDPIKGFTRMFSMRAVIELFKSLFKIVIVGAVAWGILAQTAPMLLSTIAMAPLSGIQYTHEVAFRVGFDCCALLLVLAILDYMYQRFEFEKSIRMSKQEIKDEFKNQEGDPLIKRRIREMGRKIAMSRMFEQLRDADAVIINPTHFAVALRYELDWPAPRVLAKGQDYTALRIIRYAEEQGIPVYQQPQLARALYKVELGEFVPATLFKAVAKILAQLSRHDSRLRAKLRGAQPASAR